MTLSFKIQNQTGKHILKELLYQYVPKSLLDRPKKGFGIPYDTWLRSGLREWAESLLDKNKLLDQGYFNVDEVHRYWSEHTSGKRNWQSVLWNVLMFQAWHDHWMKVSIPQKPSNNSHAQVQY